MFRKFLDFVKEEKQYDFESSEQFLKTMGGKSFLNVCIEFLMKKVYRNGMI